ncbi:TonB-dependent receptor domain-containing protein [Allopusillimonas ginsengisoli]|uniref:TonB-dependent receptor domain-containing protein n=1 Tax=Allopusillimonas ginsengisoli TaxID=453575 RepID=UPI001FD6C646|nr:TonB-dependent receptor [Allopusillimonas ginsengisoli]
MLIKVNALTAALAFAFGAGGVAHAASSPDASAVTRLETITINAYPLSATPSTLSVPVETLDGSALVVAREATLGATLSSLPGVHADTFGAGASRPAIRGQTAPRVKVLSGGSELMDASGVSPDHAITSEPMLAQRIEVLRGPSTLLYGGGAIGGVVNVVDNKIPQAIPEKGVEGFAEVRGATGSRERAGAVGVTAGEGNVAVHVEGVKRRSGDYRVPGWTHSRVAGSYEEGNTGSVGISWIGSRGYTGIAYTQTHSKYGLPGHSHEYEGCHPHGTHLHCGGHDHDDEHDEHDHHDHAHGDHDHDDHAVPFVRLDSRRLDLRSEYRDPFAGFSNVRFRGGYTDYKHDEIEGTTVATTFKNRGYDARLELEHRPVAGWHGVLGLQSARSTFSALGEERFVPKTVTRSNGIFLLEQYHLDDWRFELGARQDWQNVSPDSSQPASRLRGTSFSAGAVWDFAPQYALAVSLSRSQRLPSAQELYANGLHMATNTYELGNPGLAAETSRNIDLTLRKQEGDARFSLTVFHNRIKNYIFANTLDRYEDFRLIEYTQRNARFTGVEGEASYRFNRHLTAGVFGDLVHGKLFSGADLPRIPAARAGVRVNTRWNQWTGNIEAYRVFRQNRVADFEAETSAYNMVNLGLGYDGTLGAMDYSIYLRATNLLNTLAYNHASFVSRAAPLPGRRVMLGMRMEY